MDYEQLGVFYLGKKFDLAKGDCTNELVLYESQDLLTHAVVVGMTGSGKTGLGIDLLEEAAIDNIPVVAIDPKGDLSNLLLTFPELSAADFAQWVDADEARRKQVSPEQLAESEATKWSDGLHLWHQDKARIKKLKESAEFAVYTPASTAAIPLSIVSSFACPDEEVVEDRELLREQISSTATSILSLLGIDSDPLKSKEHILLSSILDHTWKQGIDLDLHSLIGKIQDPPIRQFGAIPLESFFSSKDRYELAMQINNLLAAPGFEAWMEGESLDIDKLFYSSNGKNRVSIISISHLSDSERMFFVSLFLTQLLAWMRKQSGTSSLRAIFYMDELLGYLPPVANPPSKTPLLTLLKQARAFGLGLVLATQNPVDLDYKALGNAGTWFIGRLQTERDKLRVLDGLEGAASASGGAFNRTQIDQLISGLSKQVFLVNNVHEGEPYLLKTRHSLSYLRGPLSRAQMKVLKKSMLTADSNGSGIASNTAAAVSASAESGTAGALSASAKKQSTKSDDTARISASGPPLLPPEISQFFAPIGKAIPVGSTLVYKPMLFASLQLRYSESKAALDYLENCNLLTLIKSENPPVRFDKSFATRFGADSLRTQAEQDIDYSALPPEATVASNYKQWSADLVAWLMANKILELYKCPISGQVSKPHESEKDFRIRLSQESREKRDEQLAKLSKKYSSKLEALHDKYELAEMNVSNQVAQQRALEFEAATNVGASIFDAFVGRRANIRRAESAVRKASQVSRKRAQVSQAQETRDMLAEQVAAIQAEFDAEMRQLKTKLDPETQALVKIPVTLKKTNIDIIRMSLCWAPCFRQSDGRITAAW